jgi:hypothetical protein
MTTDPHPRPRPDRIAAQRNREAAFARISRVRGASILGAGALTAAVAAVVSAVAPGHSLGAKARGRTAVASTKTTPAARVNAGSSSRLPPLASAGQLGLQAPSSAPQSDPSQPSAPAPQPSTPAPAPSQPSPPVQQSAPATGSPGPVASGGS